jgi:murein DD-endopeptidase MepM/ murein hydrolase activator NlpD
LPPEEDDDLGNYVLIDHQDGEYSLIPHMKPGSVRVKTGEHIVAGQMLGEVGFSGDAIFPHVHFALMSGPDNHHAEGVPAYFDHVIRIVGDKRLHVNHEALDTGDLVMSADQSE